MVGMRINKNETKENRMVGETEGETWVQCNGGTRRCYVNAMSIDQTTWGMCVLFVDSYAAPDRSLHLRNVVEPMIISFRAEHEARRD